MHLESFHIKYFIKIISTHVLNISCLLLAASRVLFKQLITFLIILVKLWKSEIFIDTPRHSTIAWISHYNFDWLLILFARTFALIRAWAAVQSRMICSDHLCSADVVFAVRWLDYSVVECWNHLDRTKKRECHEHSCRLYTFQEFFKIKLV